MLKKIQDNLILFILMNVFVFGFIFYFNSLMPYYIEEIMDYAFNNEFRLTNLVDIIENTNRIYLYRTGRYLPSLLVSLIMIDETKTLFNVLNSLFLLGFVNLIIIMFNLNKYRNFFLIFILALVIFIIPNFIGTTVWVLSSVEYFWPTVLMVFVLHLVKLDNSNKSLNVLIIISSLIVSTMSEIVGVGLMSYYLIRHFLIHGINIDNILKIKYFKNINFTYFIASSIGSMVVILSPAALNRSLISNDNTFLINTLFNTGRVLYYFTYYFFLPIIILIIFWALLNLINNKKLISILKDDYSHYLLSALIIIIPLALSSGFSIRVLIVQGVFILLAIVKIISSIVNNSQFDSKFIFLANISIALGLISIIVNQLHMIQEFEPRENTQNLYWFIERMEQFEWPNE